MVGHCEEFLRINSLSAPFLTFLALRADGQALSFGGQFPFPSIACLSEIFDLYDPITPAWSVSQLRRSRYRASLEISR